MLGLLRAPAQLRRHHFFLTVDDTSTSNMEEEKKIDDDDADALVAAVSPRKARTEKEDFVKAPLESPPMSFKAGGGKKGRPSTNGAFKKEKMAPLDVGRQSAVVMSSSSNNSCNGSRTNIATSPYHRSVIRSGLDGKRSAFEVKNWITCLLTLDGRDKFTKILQYSTRMMCWYFAVLANRAAACSSSNTDDTPLVNVSLGTASFLHAFYSNHTIRQKYYLALSKRFNELCQALVTSRKAFRIGRSIIEWDKIAQMGVFDYLNYMLLQPLADSPTIVRSSQSSSSSSLLPRPKMAVIATPSWKLVGTTIKFLGLMGFWAFDNIAFVTGSGFLDPIIDDKKIINDQVHPALNYIDVDNVVLVNPKSSDDRTMRKTWSGEWANRFYFLGALGGLYVNLRSLYCHWNTELKNARDQLQLAADNSTIIDDINAAKANLEKVQRDHFDLRVALTKSIVDIMVFGNNPGVDLFVKYRGKKNHEGLHCIGGLVSASTVLYNNFPNSN